MARSIRGASLWIILRLLISESRAQDFDCNMETERFSHRVRNGIRACSEEFHRKLQAYYPTAGQFAATVEVQPPRAISAPVPMRYSAMGDSVFFSNTSNWGTVCQLWVLAAGCVEAAVIDCDIAVSFKLLQDRLSAYKWSDHSQPELLAPEYAFSERTCESGRIKAELQRDLDRPDLDLGCLSQAERMKFKQCVKPLTAEIVAHKMRSVYATTKDRMVLDSMSGSVLRCIRNMLDMSTCNSASQRIWNHIGQLNIPSFFVNPPNVSLPASYDFSQIERCTVGAYGDPHFRLCDRPKLATCSLPGEHIFLSNHFFEIRATNSKVEVEGMINPAATAITRVRVTFKSVKTSEEIGVYEAAAGNLPAGFQKLGTTQIGHGDDEVSMTVGGNKRTFLQKSTGMILVVRRWETFYQFIVRMSRKVLDDSFGTLLTGCTMLQTIHTNGWVQNHRTRRTRRDLTVDQCIAACADLPESMGIRVSCSFDCGVTRKLLFVNISRDAWRDMAAVETDDQRLRLSAKTEWVRDRAAAATGTGNRLANYRTLSLIALSVTSLITSVL